MPEELHGSRCRRDSMEQRWRAGSSPVRGVTRGGENEQTRRPERKLGCFSNPCRHNCAAVAELADAPGREPGEPSSLRVQVPPAEVCDECRWNYMVLNPMLWVR